MNKYSDDKEMDDECMIPEMDDGLEDGWIAR